MKRYFAEGSLPTLEQTVAALPTKPQPRQDERTPSQLPDSSIVLEQYKLYVELADRVSARRMLANTFFLTLNTAGYTLIAALWKDQPNASPLYAAFPLAALLLQCLIWFWIIRSYRQLNAGKWLVVGALETYLPASPWYAAEWKALGEGKDPTIYWPLTHVEKWVPALFAAAYSGGFVAIVWL